MGKAHGVALLLVLSSASRARAGVPTTGAEPPPREARDARWDLTGEAKVASVTATPFVAGPAGRLLDPRVSLGSRLLLGGRYVASDTLRFELEVEAANGLIGGATSLGTTASDRPFPRARDGRADLARVLPRKAYVAWTTKVGQVLVGAQTFGWGTGMLANDGAGDPAFGDPWLGNVVARAAFATRPLQHVAQAPLLRSAAVFIGLDAVLRDDNASIYDGDRAFAAVLGIRSVVEHDGFGLLVSARTQTDRQDPARPSGRARTQVLAFDGWAKTRKRVAPGQWLGLEAEAAFIAGESTRPWSDATFRDGATVRQLGGVGRARYDHDAAHLTATLEGGYASGDNDPRDDVARTFTMHTDHNVGLVLFEHVLPLLSARGADRAADPRLVARPSPGLRFAINPGAVQNAMYAHPVVRLRPVGPLEIRLGYVYATPAADLIDAYQTGARGGFATSAGGKTQWRGAYGHEVDLRVSTEHRLDRSTRARLAVEAGVLMPGAAFEGLALSSVWVGRATFALFF